MVDTRRSAAAAANPGGGGSDGGEVGRDGRKRPAATSSAPPPPPRTKRSKDEAHARAESPPPRRSWAKLLSQNSQTPHVLITASTIYVGSGHYCHIKLDDQSVGGILCLLRHLEQGGPCELEVPGQSGLVVVNGTSITQGSKVPLRGGDEVIFGQSTNHAYIFQHPLRDTKFTRAECALEIQSDPNPSATSSLRALQTFKDELKQGIVSPKDIDVTFDNFPYYLSEITKEILLLSAFIHMEKEFNTCLQINSSPNQRILLSGPSGSEMYQEALTKALAKHFDARLLVLDSLMLCGTSSKFQESLMDSKSNDAPTSSSGADIVGISNKNTFREGDRVEYILDGSSACGCRGKVVLAFEENQFSKVGVRFDNPIDNGNNLGGLCERNRGYFCSAVELQPDSSGCQEVDSLALGKLIEVISEESKVNNLIVLLKDVEKSFAVCTESHASLRSELPPGVLIIGAHTQGESCKDEPAMGSATEKKKHLNDLFPNIIPIELPQNEAQLSDLKKQLEQDTENLKAKANINNIRKFLISREIECNDLEKLYINDQLLTMENVDNIVGYAVSHHLRHIKLRKGGKMVLPMESLKHAFSLVQSTYRNKSLKNALKNVITENEENVISNVISPNDSGVTFDDIGALDNVKETLKELVLLPLQRPELFTDGLLRKLVKGVLLFGPPGAGKTMLAKALANEAGEIFINVPMSSNTSKFFGEGEKYVKAIFSLASKMSPAVIFVDEIDSLLGNTETSGQNKAMRKLRNEFMENWDGLQTKDREQVIVVGATNRPYDLDDAVIGRFSRRIMVSLPDASDREKILKVLLSKETLAPNVDLELVAKKTEGYSGSDLKNLCVTAAYCPIREIIEKEKKEKSSAIAKGEPEPPLYGRKHARPLGIGDFKFALGQVCASLSPDSEIMNQIVKWNNEFGGGGSRKKETLGYFM